MTLTQLRAFLVAAATGSFTAAAEALGATQPTISELVRKLEAETGLTLFVRGGRKLKLTAAGAELLPWAQRSIDAADGGMSALEAIRGIKGGTVSIGVLRNAAYYFLPDLIERFSVEHPGVKLRVVGQNSAEVAEGVRNGDLEAGLVVLPVEDHGLQVTPLMRDEVLWVSKSQLAQGKAITIREAARSELIVYDAHYGWTDPTRRQLAERAQAAGERLDPVIEVETVGPALELARRGLGDTFVSRGIATSKEFPPELNTAPFDPPLFDIVAIISREDSMLAPATGALIDMARSMISRLSSINA